MGFDIPEKHAELVEQFIRAKDVQLIQEALQEINATEELFIRACYADIFFRSANPLQDDPLNKTRYEELGKALFEVLYRYAIECTQEQYDFDCATEENDQDESLMGHAQDITKNVVKLFP